ncbi:hypothetical protein [Amycolatopsis sp. CA-230715]|uniref:hypothetical protein n=1 Tax=Amycolatopsis sp. CA-230715 TaxID=2745196 RepID=UPI001C0324AB|nr:hypothetical protein [Amycolatopsis sp. CA-230715]QWF85765.1 hypothetical protein HUW46_09245 [Amycolatopsis sp. CA-230715]
MTDLPTRLVQAATTAAHKSAYPNRPSPTDTDGEWGDIGRAATVAVLRELAEVNDLERLCLKPGALTRLADQIEES